MRRERIGDGAPAKRLIVLLADTPIPTVLQAKGTYHDIFASLFARSLQSSQHKAAIDIESYDVVKGDYPDQEVLATADALLITGAGAAYAEEDWIEKLIAFTASLPDTYPSLRIIGICFGHQIIAMAFGGTCELNKVGGWEIGTRQVKLTDEGKRVFGEQQTSIAIQQMHRDHSPTLPETFQLLGSTDACSNHGMIKLDNRGQVQIISLQGHPEFSPDIVLPIIDAREAKGILSQEVAANARVHAAAHDDGVAIGLQLLRATDLVSSD